MGEHRLEYERMKRGINDSLEAIIFMANHLLSRPGGPLVENDYIAMKGLVEAFGDYAGCERSNFMEACAEEEAEREQKKKDEANNEWYRRQQAAHVAVAAAVSSGALVRSTQCERCPTVVDNTIGHHHDYDKPLDVEWLCRPCHGKHHAENGSAL